MAFLHTPAAGGLGYPELAWRNFAQGTMLEVTTGSGVVTGTLFTGEGILKGVFVDTDSNEDAVSFGADGDGTKEPTFASGAIDNGWTPTWLEFNSVLTINTATAQAFKFLVGTGLPPFQWG